MQNSKNCVEGLYFGKAYFSGHFYQKSEGIFIEKNEERFGVLCEIGLIILESPTGKPKNIIKSVCLIVVDYSRPWNIINSLKKWCDFIYEIFGKLIIKLPFAQQTEMRKQSKKIFINYIFNYFFFEN